jgi:hypothetical protein
MADTDYGTPDELAGQVGIKTLDPSPTDPTRLLLQRYLNSAAYVVDYVTRRPPRGKAAYSLDSGATRHFDDLLQDTLPIDDLVGTPTLITRGTVTIAPAYYKLWPYNPGDGPYTKLLLRLDVVINATAVQTSLWYGHPYKGVGVEQIAITGNWGYCAADKRPPVVKEATLIQAERMYERRGMKSKDLVNALRDPWKTIDPFVLALLDASGLKKDREMPLFA